jgi:hypothetical protein
MAPILFVIKSILLSFIKIGKEIGYLLIYYYAK